MLKLTLPGMPDFYHGTKLWDLNLVDPDNRRPVDYALREKALAEVTAALARDRRGTMRGLAEAWPDGRIKLTVVATLLEYSSRHPELFARRNLQARAWPKSSKATGYAALSEKARTPPSSSPGPSLPDLRKNAARRPTEACRCHPVCRRHDRLNY